MIYIAHTAVEINGGKIGKALLVHAIMTLSLSKQKCRGITCGVLFKYAVWKTLIREIIIIKNKQRKVNHLFNLFACMYGL